MPVQVEVSGANRVHTRYSGDRRLAVEASGAVPEENLQVGAPREHEVEVSVLVEIASTDHAFLERTLRIAQALFVRAG